MRLLIAKLAATSLRSVSFALNADGDIAELATDLDSCVRLLRAAEYDLLVLLVSEARMRAGDVIAHIRDAVGAVPMVVLTEPGDDAAELPGVSVTGSHPAGATPPITLEPDDFHHRDEQRPRPAPWQWAAPLVAHAGRRRGRDDATHPRRLGSLRGALAFDDGADGLRVDGVAVPLSQAEHRIFGALWAARGAVVGTDELLAAVYRDGEWPVSRVLPVFVFKLRKKLAGLGVGEAIETEIGRGFRLRADAVPETPMPETPMPETPMPETPVPDQPVPDQRLPDQRLPDQRLPNQRG